jgi:ParB-like chromosome segregation protein Spo0J
MRVRIRDLKEHPDNPRVGNVKAIAASLEAHGQYRPVVANTRTNRIVAGNHTVKAATKMGWEFVEVHWIDVDEATEQRILLADNRLSDIASYADDVLGELLGGLADLGGTGFDSSDIPKIVDDPPPGPPREKQDPPEEKPRQVRLGRHRGDIDSFEYERWAMMERELGKPKDIVASLRMRLDIRDEVVQSVPRETEYSVASMKVEQVRVDVLRSHPDNPREGDIGAITESLREFGQFKPVVANMDGTILAGNHVVAAARALGWVKVDVVWVDVDDEQALRILLVDNRTADLASYEDDALRRLLLSVNLDGTGWSPDDVEDILTGAPARPGPDRSGDVSCRIGEWSWKEPRHVMDLWERTVDGDAICDAVGLPRQAVTWEFTV